ncbi:MAG: transcription antitermination factor NusB [Erysipelotrichaceae bacterium]|nr:transcription antitermination factor NusB [Erysipelotrichaceae bacterium]
MTQREVALNIIYKTIHDESYSNLLMRKELSQLPVIQRSFCTNLVNEVLRKYEILNFQFKEHIKKNTSLKTRIILCMAMYEKFYLKEKDYAVNNEYVKLASSKYEKSFVNAVLHNTDTFKESDEEDVNANLPKWIYSLLKAQYSIDELEKIVKGFQKVPEVYYRINRNKCTKATLDNLNVNWINEDIFTSDRNMINTTLYKDGYFYVQDLNSASLYKYLDLKEDDIFLDMCSAPGSKLFNCLDIVKEENAYGNDVHESRVELIRKMAEKLGYKNINLFCKDGRKIKDITDIRFDKILLDAPCSGLGVINRKPDLKFHIKPESLDELEVLQSELLDSALSLLKDKGTILYSTCTLNKKENSKQVNSFLKRYPDFMLEEENTIINELGDCFYYAKLRKA